MASVYVYILRSSKTGKYYCGQTKNLNERLVRHNQGREKYTKTGTPWTLVHKVELSNRNQAVALERKVKKRGIARFLQDRNLAPDVDRQG